MPPFFVYMGDNFFTISDILNTGVFDTSKGSRALKYSTVFSFWPQIVGSKFKDSSKPLSIRSFKMFVTCENSFVVQELSMYKKVLLEKIKIYADPLGIKVSDMVFDYKNWCPTVPEEPEDDFGDFYTEDKLSEVNVDISEYEGVFYNIDSSPYLNDEQKEKFKDRIIKLKRAKELRLS